MNAEFGAMRIYYNNFAGHLLNSYNPNMLHLELIYRWSDEDWFRTVDMVKGFGFTHMEFWLVPRLFCREGLTSDFGQEFIRQMSRVTGYGKSKGLPVIALCSLATVGSDWKTLCPNCEDEWAEIRFLWDAWTKALPDLGGVEIFPGDPGACSRNGCTAETYIDRSVDIASLVTDNLKDASVLFNTWGPPFFGWGNLKGPEGWAGEFIQSYQHTAWDFDAARSERAMNHLLQRLPDFPAGTSVGINLAFNPDGNPQSTCAGFFAGDEEGVPKCSEDARGWARRIAETHPIHTWDFSLTEGENAVIPHYRLKRLFERRREERSAAPYGGGICYTMSPQINPLSLAAAARSFIEPDADSDEFASDFYESIFGEGGRALIPYLHLFEVFRDWGCYVTIEESREEYHEKMGILVSLLEGLAGEERSGVIYPEASEYRLELLFFAILFRDLSAPAPDYTLLRDRYWDRVYKIYDSLPEHVDPRPHQATESLIRRFREWGVSDTTPAAGQWVEN
ncbi:MAG: hypothetical protein ACYTGH_05555 [Planctomycetota bacterium]|jgi:hypothetical protein